MNVTIVSTKNVLEMIFVNYGTTFGLSWLLGNLPFEKPWYWLLKNFEKKCMVMVLVKCSANMITL